MISMSTLAGDKPLTILDMGSGTGRLSLKLAARGHRVTGADPAARHDAGGAGEARCRQGHLGVEATRPA